MRKNKTSKELEEALGTLTKIKTESEKKGRHPAHNRQLQDILSSLKTSGRIVQRIHQHGSKLDATDLYSLRAAASQANQANQELFKLVGALEREFAKDYTGPA